LLCSSILQYYPFVSSRLYCFLTYMEVRSKVLHGLLVKLTYDLILLSFFMKYPKRCPLRKVAGFGNIDYRDSKLSAFSRSMVTLISGLLNFKFTSVVEK
jgi:hypothetical protein